MEARCKARMLAYVAHTMPAKPLGHPFILNPNLSVSVKDMSGDPRLIKVKALVWLTLLKDSVRV